MPSDNRTIISELCRPNPTIDDRNTRPGANTSNPHWPSVTGWNLWREFNPARMYHLYKDLLKKAWRDPTRDLKLTLSDLEIWDEDGFEHGVLTKFIMPSVNSALSKAYEGDARGFDLGRAGRSAINPDSDQRYRPDWTLGSSACRLPNGFYINYLPGETKLAIKWQSTFYPNRPHHWKGPVEQLQHYCLELGARYGFIITNQELVVFRCREQAIGPSGMANRPTRGQPVPAGHYREQSGSSDIADMLHDTSLASEYEPPANAGEFHPIEYQVIPWANAGGDGKTRFTVRSALFFLSLMASKGPVDIQTDYAPLDSWYFDQDQGHFKHNTTGKVSRTMPRHGSLQWFDPSASGPLVMVIDGQEYLTRDSVTTLNIDRDTKSYFYLQEGETVLIRDRWIYDTEHSLFGCFQELKWVYESQLATSGGSHQRRRR